MNILKCIVTHRWHYLHDATGNKVIEEAGTEVLEANTVSELYEKATKLKKKVTRGNKSDSYIELEFSDIFVVSHSILFDSSKLH